MCVSAWSSLAGRGAAAGVTACEARGWRGAGHGSSLPPPATATRPRHLRQSPAVGAGGCHRQGEQAKVCTLPACTAGGSGERSCCPINSHRPRSISPSAPDGSPQKGLIPSFHLPRLARRRSLPTLLPCAGPSCSLVWAAFASPGARHSLPPWIPAADVTSRVPQPHPKRAHAISHSRGMCSTGVGCAPWE